MTPGKAAGITAGVFICLGAVLIGYMKFSSSWQKLIENCEYSPRSLDSQPNGNLVIKGVFWLSIFIWIKFQWRSFPMLTFWEFSASNSCCSILHQQETSRYRRSNLLIMLDRWFGFRESRIPTVPYSYWKYYNYTVITLEYTLTLIHYLDNHQQPLWLILRWLHNGHIELEPSFQYSSSFHFCIRQLSIWC